MGKKTASERMKGFSLEAFQTMVFQSADWPTAIMTGQLLDTFLEFVLSVIFENPLQLKDESEIFGGYGPLSTFASRITIGYAMGAMTIEIRDDLRVIKQIRNHAAHRMSEFRFDEPEISACCEKLQLVKAIPQSFLDSAPLAKEAWGKIGFTSSRARFSLSALYIFTHLATVPKERFRKKNLLNTALAFEQSLNQPENKHKIIQILDELGIPHDLREPSPDRSP